MKKEKVTEERPKQVVSVIDNSDIIPPNEELNPAFYATGNKLIATQAPQEPTEALDKIKEEPESPDMGISKQMSQTMQPSSQTMSPEPKQKNYNPYAPQTEIHASTIFELSNTQGSVPNDITPIQRNTILSPDTGTNILILSPEDVDLEPPSTAKAKPELETIQSPFSPEEVPRVPDVTPVKIESESEPINIVTKQTPKKFISSKSPKKKVSSKPAEKLIAELFWQCASTESNIEALRQKLASNYKFDAKSLFQAVCDGTFGPESVKSAIGLGLGSAFEVISEYDSD